MKLIPFLLIFVTSVCNAQWLCREESSIKRGSTITACGVGTSPQLDEARRLSGESAISEFNRLCLISSDCKNFNYNVHPKRTDCEEYFKGYKCFRAVDFEILESKQPDVFLDLEQAKRDIALKQNQVLKEQENLEELQRIQSARQLSSVDLNVVEPRYALQLYINSITLGTKYWSQVNSEVTLSYERKLTSWFGLEGTYGYGHDLVIGDTTFVDLSIATKLYPNYYGTYLKVETGNASSFKRVLSKDVYQPDKNYVGASLGYDSKNYFKGFGWNIEAGGRQILSSQFDPTLNFGLSFGF